MFEALLNETLIIIVLYCQNIDDSLTFQSLIKNTEITNSALDVYVYDNSPYIQYSVGRFQWKKLNIIYTSDINNSGVSGAYNSGAMYAKNHNKKWLILLDQDTILSPDYLEKNLNAIELNQHISLFVPILKLANNNIFSPFIYKHKRGYHLKEVKEGTLSLSSYFAVNSGMFLKVDSFYKAGGYNPNLKLDFCDFQFLEKYSFFFKELYLIDCICIQNFSNLDKSITRQIKRFLIFLEDAINCDKPKFTDKLGFLYVVTRHTIGLAVKLKSFSFLSIYVKNYLIKVK